MSYKEQDEGFRRTEEDLKESERRYRDLANCLPQGVSEVDMEGNITFTNHTCLIMFGYTREDFDKGLNIFQMMAPEDCERAKQNILKFLKGEKRDGSEYTGIRKDGTRFPFTVYLNPVFCENKPVGFRVIVIDITDRKRSEEALRASQRQLSQAMDLAHIVYWEFDTTTKTYLFNDPYYALYGTTAGKEGGYAMTTKDYAKRFVHPDDQSSYQQRVKRYTSERNSQPLPDFEYRIIRRDGEVRHILGHEGVIKDNAGYIVKRYGANQDITERKEMQKALLQSEEQFRKMFEGSPIGKILIGADLHYIKANEAFCRMLGYTEQDLASLTLNDITHPDYVAEDRLRMDDLLSGKVPLYETEKRYIRKDKGIVWGSAMVNVIRDRDNRFLYFLTTIVDITERKQSEEEKIRLESQLFRAQKMEAIGTLAGGIAHDFNNILTALVGYAALLKMKISDATLHAYVEHILSASQKATDLVQNLLAFSKQQAVSLKPISLHHAINDTKKLLERLVTEDISIKTNLAAEEITIMADTTQVDQILFNLATNARDAMPHGGTLTIETKTVELDDGFKRFHGYGEPGTYALLSISDTGEGMDKTIRDKIFDPFFTTKEVGKGTGLGLSTVYGIVKQHNGYITVYSEPGIGTAFHVYLPLADQTGKEEHLTLTPVEGGKETILVAEDDHVVRDLMKDVLIEFGYTVIPVNDGEDAVEYFRKTDGVDLLILDSVMPKKNGREAYNEIHELKPGMKVIFTSGYTRDVFLDKGIEDKEFNFLQKPISPDTLLQEVRKVLDDEEVPE